MTHPTHRNRTSSVILAVIFGVLLVITITYVFARERPVTDARALFLLRIGAALGAAGLAASLPGFLELDMKPGSLFSLRAGGSLAVFVVIYMVNPPTLVTTCEENATRECLCPARGRGVQTCSGTGAWGKCDGCPPLTFCQQGSSRDCPCASGSGLQACSQNGMWESCRCPHEQSTVQASNEGDEGDEADEADEADEEPELVGVWHGGGDTIRLVDSAENAYEVSGTALGPGVVFNVAGTARRAGDTVRMDLAILLFGAPVDTGHATMMLESERYMTGNLTFMSGGSTAWQLSKE